MCVQLFLPSSAHNVVALSKCSMTTNSVFDTQFLAQFKVGASGRRSGF